MVKACSRLLISSSCWLASNSLQQETKEALNKSLASCVYLCATVQHARKAGDGDTFEKKCDIYQYVIKLWIGIAIVL